MKINTKILNIPPHISTSWENISSLSLKDNQILVIELRSGSRVEIPDLPKSIVDAIFDMHAKYLDEDTESAAPAPKQEDFLSPFTNASFKIGGMGIGGLESMSSAMQHNSDQRDAPDLPPEILGKIASISKVLGMDDPNNLPKPEPHCNCVHCQIAKTLQKGLGVHAENLDEDVSDEDLKFRTWDIEEISSNLYTVTNPLDVKEQYNVYLGEPIGCTCGENDCEHIRSVLNS